ncbi:MAG: bifunctional oligoribonuclease/PAP phosphatase NrnA [Spirochaetaceae bacterium]|jgi:phosphoesterase RecJ-like protein|nr:bifunctional oligoribonuclease/PAP phosphatase NrnA [Spirochaetaceae bacterium]
MPHPVAVPRELLDFIRQGARFFVAGHKEPDGDCVGSQLALSSALRRLGKQAFPCSAGPFKRPEILRYKDRFLTAARVEKKRRQDRGFDRAIILDCSSLCRAGDIAEAAAGAPLAVIDHHAAGQRREGPPDQAVYLDPDAPATAFMVLDVIEALGLALTSEEAELLLLGLCADTGFFRHTGQQGAETFMYAARMVRAGASPKRIYDLIHGGKSLGSRYLLGRQLGKTRSRFRGRLLVATEDYEDTQRFGMDGRDSDSLYQLLQTVAEVEAVVVIRQETPDACAVGFRSKDAVNVAKVAALFGGGGHKNAAGASLAGTIETVYPAIIAAFEEAFREAFKDARWTQMD